jgi:hypothetical protein
MRLLLSILAVAIGAGAQAPAPVFFTAGPLSCGLRVYTPGSVQQWCYYIAPGAAPVTVCNSIDLVRSASTLPVSGSVFCMAVDATAGLTYQVGSLVWQPIAALPPSTSGTIQYQIVTSTSPCVLTQPGGVCVQNGNPTTNLQTGTLPSGVPIADLWPREWVLTPGLSQFPPGVYRLSPSSPLAR